MRWLDAARLYLRSAQLEPTFERLLKASEHFRLAGQYGQASAIGLELLEYSKSIYGEKSTEAAAATRVGFMLRCFQHLSLKAWLPSIALSDNW